MYIHSSKRTLCSQPCHLFVQLGVTPRYKALNLWQEHPEHLQRYYSLHCAWCSFVLQRELPWSILSLILDRLCCYFLGFWHYIQTYIISCAFLPRQSRGFSFITFSFCSLIGYLQVHKLKAFVNITAYMNIVLKNLSKEILHLF